MQSILQLYIKSFSGLSKDIWLLSFITLINRIGTVVFIFLSIYLSEELGFSKKQIGVVMAFHGVGSAAGAFIGGWLTDRIGYYRVIFWSLIIVGFLYMSLYLVESFFMFCVMGFLTSLVGDAFRPAGMASITIYGGEELQTRSMSLYRLAINLGFGLGMGIAGLLSGRLGYESLFFLDGGTCIVAGFFFILLLENKKEVSEKSKEENVKEIKYSAYRDYWFVAFVLLLMINAMVFIQLFYTFPLFCKEVLMMTEEGYGALMSYNGLLIFAIEMPMIYVIAKRKDQVGWIALGVALIGLSFLIFNIFGFTIIVAIVSMTLVSVGEIINFPLASSIGLSRSNANNRGQYMGLYSMCFSIGLVIAPLFGFWIVEEYGYRELWYFLGILATISTGGLMVLREKYNKEQARLVIEN